MSSDTTINMNALPNTPNNLKSMGRDWVKPQKMNQTNSHYQQQQQQPLMNNNNDSQIGGPMNILGPDPTDEGWMKLFSRAVAEFIGTTLFIFLAQGIVATAFAASAPPVLVILLAALGGGLAYATALFMFAAYSGGYFDPFASFGMWILPTGQGSGYFDRKSVNADDTKRNATYINIRTLIVFIIAQLGGSFVGALLLLLVFGKSAAILDTIAPVVDVFGSGLFTTGRAFFVEVICSWILYLAIFRTTYYHSSIIGKTNPYNSIVVTLGIVYAAIRFFAYAISGGAFNPMMALGPSVIANIFSVAWIWYVGPALGAGLAIASEWLLRWANERDVLYTLLQDEIQNTYKSS